ncbi:MAG: hypothetical protein GWO23_03595, partial [Gammaproteobacteria bacterium]|nr:hypothetical protein [Gammaproteobacteria bacterium]NIW98347.1 hypothetical protein [Phycisphaerae bacterium]
GFTSSWFEALRQNPNWLWVFVILFIALNSVRVYAVGRTRYHAMSAWAALKKGKDAFVPTWYTTLTSYLRKFIKTPVARWLSRSVVLIIFLLIVYLFIALINGTAFYLGYT